MPDDDVPAVGGPDPMMVTTGSEHAELATFVDRVIVPALVERFLRDHRSQTPESGTLVKTKPAA